MIDKPIDSLTFEDIASLVANSVRENRSLDYKESLPSSNDKAQKDFLADVASFANTVGGHILFGISEERDENGHPTGIPDVAIGLPDNLDAETLRLESVVRECIDPRIPNIQWRSIGGGKSGDILVCWIPKSWQAPHMVTFRGSSRFYARAANGKYQLDVRQLRDAFIASETLREAVRRFRQDRLAKIASDEAAPTPLESPARIVLHVIPLACFDPRGPTQDVFDLSKVRPRAWSGGVDYRRHNFDGVLGYNSSDGRCMNYVQVFRNASIETVDACLLRDHRIPSIAFEQQAIAATKAYLDDLTSWGIGGPFLVMLSLVGVRGYHMAVSERLLMTSGREPGPIDRDMVVVPELWLDHPPPKATTDDIARLLRPTLDIVWQAAGWERSPNFTAEGNWHPRH